MAKITPLAPDSHGYRIRNRSSEGPILAELRQETRRTAGELAGMLTSEEQGVLLMILVGALATRLAVDIGSCTGYGAACIASALPPDGNLACCHVGDGWTAVGTPYRKHCAVAGKVDLRHSTPSRGCQEACASTASLSMPTMRIKLPSSRRLRRGCGRTG